MKPQSENKSETFFKDKYLFYETLAALRTPEEARDFLKDLLTRSELIMVHRRWFIGRLLTQGGSIREIAYRAKVGTDTVVRLGKKLSSGTGVLRNKLKALAKRDKVEEGSIREGPEKPVRGRYTFGG